MSTSKYERQIATVSVHLEGELNAEHGYLQGQGISKCDVEQMNWKLFFDNQVQIVLFSLNEVK